MLVHNLPDIIIRLILKHTISTRWHGTNQWYSELNVLSVCRQWRYLALPYHYRRLFLIFNNAPISCPYCKNKSTSKQLGTTNKVRTNLGSFGVSNSIRYAKVCTIILGSSLHMLDLLDDMRITFKDTFRQLGGVERVELLLSKRFKSEGLVDLNELPKVFADRVGATFPGAHMLVSSCSKDNVTGIAMVNSLVDVYSDRLCRLAIDVPALCKALQFPQQLTHLTLDFEYSDIMHLPQIHISSLLYLSVNDVPVDLDWMDAFGGEPDCNNSLIFSNLRSFSISYRNNVWRTEMTEGGAMAGMDEMYCPSYKLVFPRLETVTIHMCPSRGGILQFSEFPSQGLKRLELGNAICSDISLDGIKRPIVVEHLVICATITQTANRQDPVYVYNSIVDKVKSGVHGTTIIMPFGTALTKPLQARWQSLSKLELYEPTPISMLLELVPRLPSLKRLTAHYLIIDADCKVSSIAKDYSCSILSYSLNELILDTYDTGHDEKFQRAVCYIMALAPQLNVVVVPETVRPALWAFINRSEATYDHLSNILV